MLSASRSRLSLGWVASPRMQIRQIVCSVDDQNAEIEIRRPDEERIPITERQNSNFRVVPGIWRKSIMSPSGKVLVISPMQLNPRAIKSGISSDPMPGISFANGVFPRHLTPFFLHDVVGRTISKKSSKIDRMNIRHLKSLLEENPELLRGDLKHMEDPSPLFHWAQALSNARWSKEIDHMRAQIFKAVPKFDFGTPYFDLSPEFVPSIAESLLAMNNLKINKYTDWIRIERPLIAWIYEATTFYIDRYDSNDISVLAMFFTYIGIRHSMDENAVGVAALGLKFLTDTVIDRSRHISIDAMVKVLSSLCAAQQWKNEAFEVFADEIVRNRHGSMFPPGHLVELLWVYTHRYVMSKGEAWIPKELFEFILFELSLESSINKLSPKQLKKIAELLNLLKFFDA